MSHFGGSQDQGLFAHDFLNLKEEKRRTNGRAVGEGSFFVAVPEGKSRSSSTRSSFDPQWDAVNSANRRFMRGLSEKYSPWRRTMVRCFYQWVKAGSGN